MDAGLIQQYAELLRLVLDSESMSFILTPLTSSKCIKLVLKQVDAGLIQQYAELLRLILDSEPMPHLNSF